MPQRLFVVPFVLLALCLFCVQKFALRTVSAETPPQTQQRTTDVIAAIDLRGATAPITVPDETRLSSDPTNPYATLRTVGVVAAEPGAVTQVSLNVRNFEAVTRTVTVSTVLPEQLIYLDPCLESGDCANDLAFAYTPATRTLFWEGQVAPAHLDYNIESATPAIPYLDLADYGVANLCDTFLAADTRCDAATMTFNLGVNGYAATLYGSRHYALTVSTDGLVMGADAQTDDPATLASNRWLPHQDAPSLTLAGLWRDSDLTEHGRWHVAILDGLVAGHPVFYAQWHNAPHAADANLTVRHAIAVVLDGSGGMDGHVFYLYDNLSDPAATVAHGYTIGIADGMGERGQTYAFGVGTAASRPPQGYPPLGTLTLHLYPTLIQPSHAAGQLLTYSARVNASVPETITTTAIAMSDSADPALAYTWSTHYLAVRWQTYLPIVR